MQIAEWLEEHMQDGTKAGGKRMRGRRRTCMCRQVLGTMENIRYFIPM